MATTTIERPLTVTPYLNGNGTRKNTEWTFGSVTELWDALDCWRANGVWVRVGFYATRALIDAGAYEQTWDELRAYALEELEADMAGTGHGISSSDVNHRTVATVETFGRVERELAAC
jgi:hypothetical protein